MEFIKRSWSQFQAYFEQMPSSSKWLIASLVVIMLLTAGILLYSVSGAERVPISSFASGQGEQVLARLRNSGIEAEQTGGRVTVPQGKRDDAIAILVQDDLLSANASDAFDEMVSSPWETNAQGRRKYLIAKQQVLGSIAGKMQGIRSAKVMIDIPEEIGFGRTNVTPTASVAVTMKGSTSLDRRRVAALAGLVSGAVADMDPGDVDVIDSSGRLHRVGDPQDQAPSRAMELARKQELYHKRKIERYLRIPKALVAVSVQTNPVSSEYREKTDYMETEPLASESRTQITERDIEQGGEPGPRSNVGATIQGSGGPGHTRTEETTQSRYGDKQATQFVKQTVSGHQIEQINATINVPRQYFVSLYQAQNPDAEAPDDATLKPLIDKQLASIKSKVLPLIDRGDQEGKVETSMYYNQAYLKPAAAAGSGAGALSLALDSSWTGTAIAGALGLVALGLMFYMVRRTTKEEDLPSVQDLAGVPEQVPDEDQMVGEANEDGSAMAGVELDDGQIQSRRVAEQIGDLIKSNPEEAGGLLGKWVRVDE